MSADSSDGEGMNEPTYFLTVEWCNDGMRGIFCDSKGNGFCKNGSAHTEDEAWKILGPFDLILNPKSLPFTEEELSAYSIFRPLAEYTNAYGIALEPEHIPIIFKPEPAKEEDERNV